MNRFFYIALLLFFTEVAAAQQEWTFTQYQFNLYDVNAAYAGNHHVPSFSVRHRSQWVGMDGAPTSQQLSAHAPLMNEKLGIGFKLHHESIGAREQISGRISLAYKIPLGKARLSLAVAGGMIQQRFRADKINAREGDDLLIEQNNWNLKSQVFDAAVMYTSDKMYLGLECDRLNKAKFYPNKNSLARLYMHANLVGGYMIKIRENDLIQPSFLLRTVEGKLFQSEINLMYLWNNKLWLGAGYRMKYGVLFTTCWQVNPMWRLGYSYDLATNGLRGNQDGSHEIFLGFNLKQATNHSIRYF